MKVLTSSSRVEQFCSCVLVIAFVQLVFSSIARAQDLDTVTIAGRITDQNGAVIPGATVLAVLIKTSVPRTMNADDRGRYRMVQLEPGVSEEPLSTRDLAEDRNRNAAGTPEEAGSFSLSGGAASSNNITIDGLDNNDDRSAKERFQPSLEAVEEVQIITNQFSAEYGRASGGRINIRTRGGSNKYHARAFYFFRDDWFNANTSNNKARGISRLPLTEHDPGITFSGPLRLPFYDGRKKTFFFTAYEYDTILDSATIDTLVPIQPNPLFAIPPPTVTDPAVIGSLRL